MEIMRLDVAGDIIVPDILHTSTTDPLTAIIVGGSITDTDSTNPTINGEIRSYGGTIKLVQAGGDIQPPIRVVSSGGTITGEITKIESTGGDVGGPRPYTSPSNASYQGTRIEAGTIGTIKGENIRSNITATVGVKNIETTVMGLRGNLVTPKLLDQSFGVGGKILVKDGCNMNMEFTDELPAAASIVVGSFYGYDTATGTGTLPTQPKIWCSNASGLGLKGQIIFNAADGPIHTQAADRCCGVRSSARSRWARGRRR
jgi:hypothetical protein